jgi:hypothetical protein
MHYMNHSHRDMHVRDFWDASQFLPFTSRDHEVEEINLWKSQISVCILYAWNSNDAI